MSRQFGIPTSRPVDLEGASTVDRALSRAGAARDPHDYEMFERAARFLVLGFFGFVALIVFAGVVAGYFIVDFEGVSEQAALMIRRLFDCFNFG